MLQRPRPGFRLFNDLTAPTGVVVRTRSDRYLTVN